MVYLLVNERCATLVIMDMKTMSHIAKKEFNLLNLRNLVGIGFAVTSSFTYRYRTEPSAGVRQRHRWEAFAFYTYN